MKVKLLLGVLLLPMCLSAQQFVTINVALGGFVSVNAINPSGTDIIGTYYDGVNRHGFLLRNGKISTLTFPAGSGPANWTNAAGVNDANIVVGDYFPDGPAPVEPEYGFAYNSKKAFASFEVPGPKMTWFSAINNHGDIVGYYQDSGCEAPPFAATCHRRGLLLSNGHLSTIQFPGSVATTASGINSQGDIIGSYGDSAGSPYSFTRHNGVYRQFTKVPGATLTGINDSGDVVGQTGSGSFLLSSSGAFYAITLPGAASTYVAGIANRNRNKVGVVGTYFDSGNVAHGFYAVVTLR